MTTEDRITAIARSPDREGRDRSTARAHRRILARIREDYADLPPATVAPAGLLDGAADAPAPFHWGKFVSWYNADDEAEVRHSQCVGRSVEGAE